MSSNPRRVITDSESESESESEEEETKPKVSGKQQELPKKDEELIRVSDSESESGSDFEEEQTKGRSNSKRQALPMQQQQQQKQEEAEDEIESESESESESDRAPEPEPEPRYKHAKRDNKPRGATKAPLVTQTLSGKRERDANGVKGVHPTDELENKKTNEGAAKDRSQPQNLPLSPGKSPSRKERKTEQAGRGSTRAAGTAAKMDNGKPQAASKKRKPSTPPPAAASARQQHPQKVEIAKSPAKPKKPFSWSSADEETLVDQVHKDHLNGLVIPTTKVDSYWEKLKKRLSLDEDLTAFQLCEKVRRMKQRYQILKDRAKDDGARQFKSQHEEKIYQLWVDIWGSGAKTSQPAAEEGQSEDEPAETAAALTLREVSKRGTRQSNGGSSKGAETQGKGGELDSVDENEVEEVELTQREPPALNQMNAADMAVPETVAVSPFTSKPRLEFTPVVTKEDKSKVPKKVEEVTSADQHGEEVPPRDDRRNGNVGVSVDYRLQQLREETHAYFQELRGCHGTELPRNRSFTGGFGSFAYAGKGIGWSGVPEGLGVGSGSPAALELLKKWREIRIQELSLHRERLQLMQEHFRLEEEELKLQNQRDGTVDKLTKFTG